MDVAISALAKCLVEIKTIIANHKKLREKLVSLPITIETISYIITNKNLDGKAAESLLDTLTKTKNALLTIVSRKKIAKVIKLITSADLNEILDLEVTIKGYNLEDFF
jgi:hypothetical protein